MEQFRKHPVYYSVHQTIFVVKQNYAEVEYGFIKGYGSET